MSCSGGWLHGHLQLIHMYRELVDDSEAEAWLPPKLSRKRSEKTARAIKRCMTSSDSIQNLYKDYEIV